MEWTDSCDFALDMWTLDDESFGFSNTDSLFDDEFLSFDVNPPAGPQQQVPTPEPKLAAQSSPPSQEKRKRQIRKGDGPESKKNSPDPSDGYDFELLSATYHRLALLGHRTIQLTDLQKLGTAIEHILLQRRIPISLRSRNAKRRKPVAFAWFDQHWAQIAPIFDGVVFSLFGC